jgi:hypothetical protein
MYYFLPKSSNCDSLAVIPDHVGASLFENHRAYNSLTLSIYRCLTPGVGFYFGVLRSSSYSISNRDFNPFSISSTSYSSATTVSSFSPTPTSNLRKHQYSSFFRPYRQRRLSIVGRRPPELRKFDLVFRASLLRLNASHNRLYHADLRPRHGRSKNGPADSCICCEV